MGGWEGFGIGRADVKKESLPTGRLFFLGVAMSIGIPREAKMLQQAEDCGSPSLLGLFS
jgi:hypothetical protein